MIQRFSNVDAKKAVKNDSVLFTLLPGIN